MPKSLKSLVLISLGASLLLQLFFFVQGLLLSSLDRFFFDVPMVLFNITFAFTIGMLLLPLDLKVIQMLDMRLSWKRNIALRIALETIIAVILGMLIGLFVTLLYHFLFHLGQIQVIIANNLIITPIANIIAFSVAEGIFIFAEWKKTLLLAERLEKENMQARFEMLKQQLNPHFLFNSLSVLSALVHIDSEKSEVFIHKFSGIYRYILETAAKQLVPIKEELELVKSYIYLQKIRFGENLHFHCQINENEMEGFVPPLSLQLLLENSIKHNEVSQENMLIITMEKENNYIVVSNNKHPRYPSIYSTGMGLKNLTLRYSMLSETVPQIIESDLCFIVKVPVLPTV